jgi:hypothetical protein
MNSVSGIKTYFQRNKMRKEARTANSTYKKLAVQGLNEALCPRLVVADATTTRADLSCKLRTAGAKYSVMVLT